MTPEQVRQIIREELRDFFISDRYVFNKQLTITEGHDITLGATTGTKIGTGATQKLAFYGNTPIAQKSSRPATVAGVTADLASWGFYS